MANKGNKAMKIPYKYVRLVGTREAVNVFFQNTEILLASEIQGVGRELIQTLQIAARVDMPLVINFQGVRKISSALIGKLVLLHKRARAEGVTLEFREMNESVHKLIRSTTRILPPNFLPPIGEDGG